MLDVVPEEGGDHVVRMIVHRLHPQTAGVARLGSSCCEVLRLQLVLEEAVLGPLVDQDAGLGPRVVLHQLGGVVGLPGLHGPEVAGEGLLAPGHGRGVDDGGEGRDGVVHAGVLEVGHHGSVSSHAVAGDTLTVRVHREQALGGNNNSLRI